MKERFTRLAKYSFVSLTSSLVDIGLFYIFLITLDSYRIASSIFISTILARIISAFLAYQLNRTFVFNNQSKSIKKLIKFYTVNAVQMLLSASLVTYLDHLLGKNEVLEKICVDLFLFFIFYFVNKFWVFKEDNI